MTLVRDHQTESDQLVGREAGSAPAFPRLVPALAIILAAGVIFFTVGRVHGNQLAENTTAGPAPGTATTNVPGPAFEWTPAVDPITGLLPDTIIRVGSGFAAVSGLVGGDPAIWSSTDGLIWTPTPVDFAPSGLVAYRSDLVAYHQATAWSFSAAGVRWIDPVPIPLPSLVRLGYLSARPGLVAFGNTLIAQSPEGELYAGAVGAPFELAVPVGIWSRDVDDLWREATAPHPPGNCGPPRSGSVDYVPLVTTDDGLVALVAGGDGRPHGIWPLCAPSPWRSGDGYTWTRLTATSPFPTHAYVYDVAWRDGTFLAVGGVGSERPALWTSADGIEWSRRSTLAFDGVGGFQPTQIEAGPAGWIVLGEQPNDAHTAAWVSTDGECWERVPSTIEADGAAVGVDRFVLTGRGGGVWTGRNTGSCR